ncbi:bifunctional adenosylcobinamide kinase/adenosylcobinamide-phosphate guanylyltransferase [Ureibacillus sp. Re31]|uniref:Bifunctional adenosylcobinamide kinase/adenosylcobinamide-phosphate guanylyltransferase n=1 Tax=Ureibacillus galli TaxID=2762222 RepID=A0ABR8XER8_9BACL|nr:bifunctional adenosylcobinamide kinase/adenosylcobinamide-phosphate guanylyltransferase [Ureibacillus galli]MBD8027719.1 bifunctional adenosylcobinamide kinase/adenosylcobinamide-phosphate guanylyltransferase [Ureibacillus galli]
MRIVIGGAYNGKRKFVIEKLKSSALDNYDFFEGEIPSGRSYTKNEAVVIGNFEKIIPQYIELEEEQIATHIYDKLLKLEKETNVICICTDMGRGIVPLQKEERKLRDTCGRLYQKLFAESESVIRIWYGIPQLLKGEDW